MLKKDKINNIGDAVMPGVVTSGAIQEIGVVETDLDQLVIRPNSIPVDVHYFDGFGNVEMERSARWVIRFCRARGHFGPFTYDELNEGCQADGHLGDVWLNGLDDQRRQEPYLVKRGDKLHLTLNFITRCLLAGLRTCAGRKED